MALSVLEPLNDTRNRMIENLSKTDAHFVHQQKNEPDLTEKQKATIAEDILKKSPTLFLERFHSFLSLDDVTYFNQFNDDYCVSFYIEEIQKRFSNVGKNIVKNRRYQALKKLMAEGDYFSEDEMKWRDPLLFEQMVGQYNSEEHNMEDFDRSDLRFSSILLKHMDTQASKEFYEKLKEREEEQEEEEEESSDEDETDEKTGSEQKRSSRLDESSDTELETEESDCLRDQQKQEFLKIMQERFLSGEDHNFDYNSVDCDEDLDSMDIINYDAEEKYFDSEEPCSIRRRQGVELNSIEKSVEQMELTGN